jgi:uncharacterized protein
VVSEAFKVHALHARRPDLFFWRSHDGLEVDLVFGLPGKLLPVEIKRTATPSARHGERLTRFRTLAGEKAQPGLLVCAVPEPRDLPGGHRALPWQQFPRWLEEQLAPAE